MTKKKLTGILAAAAIVLIILIAAGTKKESPAPEELTGEDRTEAAATMPANETTPAATAADTAAKAEAQPADTL